MDGVGLSNTVHFLRGFMHSNKKIYAKIILLAIIITVVFNGCKEAEEKQPIIMVDTSGLDVVYTMDETSIGDVILTKKVSCEYVQTQDQEIAFETGGKIVDKVYVNVGDYVEEGDLLLTMDCGNILEEIARLEYQIKRNTLLKSYLDKQEAYDKQSEEYTYIYDYQSPSSEEEVSKHNHKIFLIEEDYSYRRQDYDDEIAFDNQKLQQLRNEYEENHVYATMAGKVVSIRNDLEGSVAKKDEVILSIVDNDNGLFEIEDKEVAQFFREGDTVPMSIIYGSAKGEYELTPTNMSEWGEKQQFEILTAPQSATLEVGISGTIVATIDKREEVIRIPNRALYDADGKYYTYVLNENKIREPRFIEIGLVGDNYSEVISGISVGTKVVCR